MARTIAAQTPEGTAEVAAFYEQTLTALSTLAEAIPPHMDERSLIELARSVTLAAGLDRLAALQFDLVSRGLARGNVQPTEQIVLAEWAGGERILIQELTSLGVGGEAYSAVQRSVASTTSASIRQVLLDDRSGNAIGGVSAVAWTEAQAARLADIWTMERDLAGQLELEAGALGAAARNRAYLVAGVSAAVVAVILAGAIAMVIRISRRLRRTRYAALVGARVELPAAIASVIAAHDANAVRSALSGSSARVEEMLHSGRDEIGELAAAFGTVHRQALRLAATRRSCGSRCRRCSSRCLDGARLWSSARSTSSTSSVATRPTRTRSLSGSPWTTSLPGCVAMRRTCWCSPEASPRAGSHARSRSPT
jgi:HAMP domain-containing protein